MELKPEEQQSINLPAQLSKPRLPNEKQVNTRQPMSLEQQLQLSVQEEHNCNKAFCKVRNLWNPTAL